MYVVGGMTLAPNDRVYSPMDQLLVFDTVQHQWQQIATLGPTPTQRRAFTLTFCKPWNDEQGDVVMTHPPLFP